MTDTQSKHTISGVLIWWHRIALTLASLLALILLAFAIGFMVEDVNSSRYHIDMYSYYMMILAGVNALCAVFLVFKKNISGTIWAIVPCVALFLCTMDIGFGTPRFDFDDLVHGDLPLFPAVLIMIMLLSQIPYLIKLKKNTGKGL